MPSVPVAPISPWICGSAEFVIEMSRVAISAPSAPAATAIQSVTLARPSCGGIGIVADGSAMMRLVAGRARIDVDRHRQPRQQHALRAGVRGEADAHRHALDDLREVAGRVFGRQQCELRARAGAKLSTTPDSAPSGSASTCSSTGWPMRMLPICVSLKFATR